jgi:hypothetical protein
MNFKRDWPGYLLCITIGVVIGKGLPEVLEARAAETQPVRLLNVPFTYFFCHNGEYTMERGHAMWPVPTSDGKPMSCPLT